MNAIRSLAARFTRTGAVSYSTATAAASPKGKVNVMEYVVNQSVEQANIDGRRELFSRKNPKGVKPGSIVLVETLNAANETSTSSFMGVCIAIRRKGIDTSFTLRNIVMRVGVEQRFSLYSPLVKSVRILQNPTEWKVRRAKLFYLRHNPGKAFQPLQNLWRQEQMAAKK
ncbi:hypothetical protein EC973_007431 [Apophysomyces ossiformis]|uniref:Ribosomal protein L19 n=1 Tax=Apophysomyces ossiformis TaxID=679940 RepID=A0A8H7BU02_9FUNG|nr:hypothetical protein EC973_007398 [Apophysomyces ossiformis]KAF7727557.1 hypothetical protein EC973_007431 [Apophysomyces ossiformis]